MKADKNGIVVRRRGLIIIGYQGIGKTTHAGKDNCVDLESSLFYLDGKRPERWWVYYCEVALSLANQGYTVFTSSHKEVRDYLFTASLPEHVGKVCVFCPTKLMKDEWIQRLEGRYKRTGSRKDYRALMNAKERFEENIVELVTDSSEHGIPVYQPSAMDYDLDDYIFFMRKKYC